MNQAAIEEVDPRIGAVLGARYRLQTRLGEGGMGTVYLAEHIELDRRVAVKVLVPELSRNRTAVERFQREARTASKIGHPNIVDVFDLGRGDDGSPYLVMELLEGRDLEDEIAAEGGRLAPTRLLEILRPIASALDVCHARGVVHRDIKPSNIFLARLGDGRECPKLVDFGLAMFFSSDERLTRSGFLAGTPFYLPPEAAEGSLPGPLGDVYSLAAIAYEALCGQLPFFTELPSGVLVKKVMEDAPSMSVRSGHEFPTAVERAVALGLARRPADRSPSATAFVEGLAEAIAKEAAWSAPPSPADRRALGNAQTRPSAPSPGKMSAVQPLVSRPPRHPSVAGSSDESPSVASAEVQREDSIPPEIPVYRPRAAYVLIPLLLLIPVGLFGGYFALRPADTAEDVVVPRDVPEQDVLADSRPTETTAEDTLSVDSAPEPIAEAPVPTDEAPGGAPEARSETAEPAVPTEEALPEASPDREPSRARRRDTVEAERLVRSAGSLLVRGDIGGATSLLERAREADSRYAPTYRSLGLAYTRANRPAEARRAYQRYLRYAPRASDAGEIRQRIAALDAI